MSNKAQELGELDLDNPNQTEDGPVECLGKTFANDEERRQYYLAILVEKLKDPEFRKIEGFPIGEDEDILNLSDPPYYTACPNPWIADFIAEWEEQKPEKEAGYHYHREPFAADVSEGKNDPIYNAHSYHTKVPHKAIMRYILHYTEPGDIVFDGFAGTGMTGVAAQMCGDKDVVLSLGYQVKADGVILQEETDNNGDVNWTAFSKLGARQAILNDLSPTATFIAKNYNASVDVESFEKESKHLLHELEDECGWMYETLHSDGKTKGTVKYTVWSDIFICSECTNEVVFWDEAVNYDDKKIDDPFTCPHCSAELKKTKVERSWTTKVDLRTGETVKIAKQRQVLIVYALPNSNETYRKVPDSFDFDLFNKIDSLNFDLWFPIDQLPDGSNTRQPLLSHGVKYVHQFYTTRNLYSLSILNSLVKSSLAMFLVTGIACRSTQMNRIHIKNFFFGGGGWNAGYLKGTLYIPSIPIETSIIEQTKDRIKAVLRAFSSRNIKTPSITETCSFTTSGLRSKSADYLFIDPPFGANINYSELNSIWESWLKVKTNNKLEAIENRTQNKGPTEYRHLMTTCFQEAYRVLKPGRWMTVEFSNTKASIWNNIQIALSEAGFIIANVSALDKKQGSFKAVNTPTAVKQDLVISAYKPNGGFEDRFINESDKDGVWDFVRTHLGYLPVSKKQGNELVKIPERDPRILFDQVVAFFVRNMRDVPLSSKEFQEGLLERFAERDGMMFLPEQVAEYDKVRITSSQLRQLNIFVDDEASSIEWLRQLLNEKPQTYQDIHPKFINELSGWKKAELQLELSTLLEQNFIKFDGQGQLPPQIHSYLSTNFKDLRNLKKGDSALLNKAKDRWYVPNPEREEDLQKLRERSLLKQFEEYKIHSGKKIRLIRMEAVRCGFKKAWQDRDYATIINVAEKIPQNLLQEDQKLLMWYDHAQTRNSESSLF